MAAEVPASAPTTPEPVVHAVEPRVASASMANPSPTTEPAPAAPEEDFDRGHPVPGADMGVEGGPGPRPGRGRRARGAGRGRRFSDGRLHGRRRRPASATEEPEGRAGTAGPCGGGGGGGGGEAPAARPRRDRRPRSWPPSEADAQAMASVGSLKPKQMMAGLGGVSSAASRTVGEQRSDLQAKPASK